MARNWNLLLMVLIIAVSLLVGWVLGRGGKRPVRVVQVVASVPTEPAQTTPIPEPPTEQKSQDVSPVQEAAPASENAALTENSQASEAPLSGADDAIAAVTVERHPVVRKPGSSKLTSHADSGAPLTANAERPTVQKTGPSKKLPDSLVVFENKALVAQAESSRNTAKDSPYKTWAARAASRRNADLAPAVTIPEATARGYLVHRVEPEYPERARRQRIQGRVVLNVVVGKDGTVQGTRPISGDSQLTLAALDAVRQWRFKPLVRNGQAVKFDSRFTFSFALP